jgi:hypothetical protein
MEPDLTPADLGGVGLADQQVAVEQHVGHVAQLVAWNTIPSGRAQVNAPCFQQGLAEGGEVQALPAVFLGGMSLGGQEAIPRVVKLQIGVAPQWGGQDQRFSLGMAGPCGKEA